MDKLCDSCQLQMAKFECKDYDICNDCALNYNRYEILNKMKDRLNNG